MRSFTSIKAPVIGTIVRIPLMIIAILLVGLCVSGQVKFNTVVSGQDIGRGDYLQVEFVIENARQIDNLKPPDFQGFQVVQGPIQSSGMSIVNGNMSQYKSLSYVLQPVKNGKFIIGGASATVDGKHMESKAVTITVSGTSSGAASGAGGGANLRPVNPFPSVNWPSDPMRAPMDVDRDIVLKPGENVKEKINKNLFVKVQVDKTSCFVGEPIVATYKLYSRLSSESKVTRRPSLNGFSVYDMVDPNSDVPSVEKLNGKAYSVHIIRKTQLIPLQAGTIELDPVEVENTVHFVKGNKTRERHSSGNALRDFFDAMSEDEDLGPEVDENITISTKPVAITIKPLPEENKPAGYTGAVGSFSVTASLVNPGINAQDEGTLHVVIKGKGNLPVLNAPQISWPAGIDGFDPSSKEEINKSVAPMSGSKSFDYVFTPRDAGHYTIPAINFPYFDPSSQSYKTASTEPLDFQVMAASKTTHHAPAAATATTSSQEEGKLGRFIRNHQEWIFAILILAFIAVYLLRQNMRLKKTEMEQKEAAAKKAAEEELEEKARQALAASVQMAIAPVVDPLEDVRTLFDQKDYQGFYRELNRAVWKALSRKLELPASELNKLNIARQLEAKGWDRADVLSLEGVLNECEMNLYTPAYDTYNMQMLLKQAEPLLHKLG